MQIIRFLDKCWWSTIKQLSWALYFALKILIFSDEILLRFVHYSDYIVSVLTTPRGALHTKCPSWLPVAPDSATTGLWIFLQLPKFDEYSSLRDANSSHPLLSTETTDKKSNINAEMGTGETCRAHFYGGSNLIANEPNVRLKIKLERNIPGVGNVVAFNLISEMPELAISTIKSRHY